MSLFNLLTNLLFHSGVISVSFLLLVFLAISFTYSFSEELALLILWYAFGLVLGIWTDRKGKPLYCVIRPTLISVKLKMILLFNVALYRLIGIYWRFGRNCCFHQGKWRRQKFPLISW
jgi:hypothetical protein